LSYAYVASPYSHPDAAIRQLRYEAARHFVAWCLNAHDWVYSPIVHCYDLALANSLRTDADFWRLYNVAMLGQARALYVLAIDGWETSKGVTFERTVALDMMPIYLARRIVDTYDIAKLE